jgi:hypothetical protein
MKYVFMALLISVRGGYLNVYKLLNGNHVKGRNKIQDKCNFKYYKIIKCIDSDRHVYLIEPSYNSGPSRVENRTNLQPCRFKERYTSDNDSDSTDDDSIAVAYPGFQYT